ncbi:hypothetical protein FHU41_000276 [Psychromicrobium silvestre]|uniref:DUF3159 domain-containing protein n=1 Tax=Psychromicrobium silvestre TaxID=1645614 RepID=A0A7Y9S4P0_9MICC|nr:DUF3159 domain-containing protein [Psychromicrobium silvestre]NYE94055.1 hypothetical protein [Psychromicrobium silvestre]
MSEASEPQKAPEPEEATAKELSFAQLAESYAARSGLSRNEHGHIDLMKAVGGWRGLAETLVPGLVFLVSFMIWQDLTVSIIAAIAVGLVFAVIRLLQRGSIVQSFSGLVGIAICAIFSRSTGNALDYYVPGFLINVVSILVVGISMLVRWPITGLLFGFIRGENLEWKPKPERVRAYMIAAWIVLALFALRLLVQVPLYFAGNLAALGTTRLAMGVPLYALALWLAWMVSRPAVDSAETSSPEDPAPADSAPSPVQDPGEQEAP